MIQPQFIAADIRSHRAELVMLNVEYVSWVFSEVDIFFGVSSAAVVGMSAPAYAEAVVEKVCHQQPPVGIFYLVKVAGQLAGMGGLHRLNATLAEVKRLYVRPGFRGHRLGKRILARLLADAESFGCARVCLESAPFMKAAHRVYAEAKFLDRTPYEEAEVPSEFHARWRFMEKSLKTPGSLSIASGARSPA